MDFQKYILPFDAVRPNAPVKPSLKTTNPTVAQVEKYLEEMKNAPSKEDCDNYSRACVAYDKYKQKFSNEQAILMQTFVVDVCNEIGIPVVKAKINASVSEMKKFYDKMLNRKRAEDEYNKFIGDIDLSVWNIPENERKFIVDFLRDIDIRDYEISDRATPENDEIYKKIYMGTIDKSELLRDPDDLWDYKQGGKVYTTSSRVVQYLIKRLSGNTNQ